MTDWKELAESWKSAAEANDRSYRVAYEALEMARGKIEELRKLVKEITVFRDNASKREEWALAEVRTLKAYLAREKKARRALQTKKAKGAKKP